MESKPPPGVPRAATPLPLPAPVTQPSKQPLRLGIGPVLIVATLSLAAGYLLAKTTIDSGGNEAAPPNPAQLKEVGNLQARAKDAEAKSYLVTAAEAMETCAVENGGAYGACGNDQLKKVDAQLGDLGRRLNVSTTADTYALTVTSATGQDFVLKRPASGRIERSCTGAGKGGCSTAGSW